jgi:hypothetical protein
MRIMITVFSCLLCAIVVSTSAVIGNGNSSARFSTDSGTLPSLDLRAGNSLENLPSSLIDLESSCVNSLLWGGPWDACLDSPYVYCAYSNGLGVLDLRGSADRMIVSTLFCPGSGQAICKSGDLVYLADGPAGLIIIDVSDPLNPLTVGSYTRLNFAQHVVVQDDLALVTCGGSRMGPGNVVFILDIADPSAPILLSKYCPSESASTGQVRDVDVSENLALVAVGSEGLQVVDISRPAHPILVGSYRDCEAWDIAVLDSLAFVSCSEELLVLNVADPHSPDSIAIFGEARGVNKDLRLFDSLLVSSWAFIYDDWGSTEYYVGFSIYNVSDPGNPTPLGGESRESFYLMSPTTIIWDTLALMFNPYPGIEVFDISDLTDPIWIKTLSSQGARELYRQDSLLFIPSLDYPGVHILDISNPARPLKIAHYRIDTSEFSWQSHYVACCDTMLYIMYGVGITDERLCDVVSISDPGDPTLIATASFGSGGHDIDCYVVSGQVLFLLNGIFDIGDPANPQLIGHLGVAGSRLLVQDTLLYVFTSGCSKLSSCSWTVFNIADPTNPVELAVGGCRPCLADVVIHDTLLYMVSCPAQQSEIWNVSDPTQPVQLYKGSWPDGTGICVSNNLAYVVMPWPWGDGGGVLDVSDPTSPVFLGPFWTPGYPFDILAVDDVLYVADLTSLLILRAATERESEKGVLTTGPRVRLSAEAESGIGSPTNYLPTAFTDLQNVPNPFNQTTQISFTLPQAALVRLEVFNVVGQRVAVLIDSHLEAGAHVKAWNASGAASGVYFYRLLVRGSAATKKMLLLK